MIAYSDLCRQGADLGLEVLGVFAVAPRDNLPEGSRYGVLLGPYEPDFWIHFKKSAEYCDGQPNPLDRWSQRVIAKWAQGLDGTAVFPFGGPPYKPFMGWAGRSGRAWRSPVGLLVHETQGLFLSYRGALTVPHDISGLPDPAIKPCDSCLDKPCLTACPVDAMTQGYDVPKCEAYLATDAGQSTCMTDGCSVRRLCPVSMGYDRKPEQSAFHMKAFYQ
jgi:epoxyqueuosine reductase